ncbi:MAG: kynureninase [Candidatus Pseudothioglobus sp.]|jgi:kynureninase
MLTRQDCIELDVADPLRAHRHDFAMPDNLIYFDGNSLGALPHCVVERLGTTVTSQWGEDLIRGWNKHWIDMPVSVGEKIAPIIGAAAGQVVCADSISVNLFKLLAAALQLNPGRHTIVSQTDNFPTDLYMAQGLSRLVGDKHCRLKQVDEAQLLQSIDDDTCVVMLTEVNFRTGRRHDVAAITRAAHARGALVLWDLAHSAGAMPVYLDDWGVDLAVGCGYKFLNGGPGAPAFLYVATRHQDQAMQPLTGWMGHAAPFDFDADYSPGSGVLRFLCGTPSVLGLSALDAALDMWRDIDLLAVRHKSQQLSRWFIELVSQSNSLQSLILISPSEDNARGSQVCYRHSDGYSMVQALIAEGIVADFRAPDILRFGFSSLYNRYVDVWDAVSCLAELVAAGTHQNARFQIKSSVT